MSVKAIFQGDVKLNYDGWFIYGEVNADVAKWYYEKDVRAPNGRKLLDCDVDTVSVGHTLVTSKPGESMTSLNLIRNYKPEEGTEAERAQIRHAVRQVVDAERKEIFDLYDCHLDVKPEVEHKVCASTSTILVRVY